MIHQSHCSVGTQNMFNVYNAPIDKQILTEAALSLVKREIDCETDCETSTRSFFIQSIANHLSSALIHLVKDYSLVSGCDIMLRQQRREDWMNLSRMESVRS